MSKAALAEVLAEHWLAQIPPFSPELVDTGDRFKGWPVFLLNYCIGGACAGCVAVYRYTPINSERSFLVFVPGT